MSRRVKAIGILMVLCLALSVSLLAYAKAGAGAGAARVGDIAQQGTSVVSTPTQIASDQTQALAGADDEKMAAESEQENESESEATPGQDPVEAPGTPGYEEGNFDGQHEF